MAKIIDTHSGELSCLLAFSNSTMTLELIVILQLYFYMYLINYVFYILLTAGLDLGVMHKRRLQEWMEGVKRMRT